MLHLDPGVHLDEEELLGGTVDEELDGPGTLVGDRAGEGHRGGVQAGANRGAQVGGEGLLDQFLAPALQRAFPLEQMDRAVAVAEHLHLDVAGAGDVALEVQAVVAEGRPGLVTGSGDAGGEIVRSIHDPYTATPAAGGRLDEQREADLRRRLRRFLSRADPTCGAGYDRHADRRGRLPCRRLVAHQRDGLGPRSHEAQTHRSAASRESRVLRQEPVARMDGVAARRQGGTDDGVRRRGSSVDAGGGPISTASVARRT